MIPYVSTVGIIVTAVFFLWVLVASTYETPLIASIGFILYMVIAQFFFSVPIFQMTIKHPETLLCSFAIYLLVGVVWSFLKWWLHIRRIVQNSKIMYEEYRKIHTGINDRAKQAKDTRITNSGISDNFEPTTVTIDSFQQYVRRDIPEAKKSVSIISVWILYWPFSMIVSLFENLLKKLIKELVIAIRKVYDAISDKILKSAE